MRDAVPRPEQEAGEKLKARAGKIEGDLGRQKRIAP